MVDLIEERDGQFDPNGDRVRLKDGRSDRLVGQGYLADLAPAPVCGLRDQLPGTESSALQSVTPCLVTQSPHLYMLPPGYGDFLPDGRGVGPAGPED